MATTNFVITTNGAGYAESDGLNPVASTEATAVIKNGILSIVLSDDSSWKNTPLDNCTLGGVPLSTDPRVAIDELASAGFRTPSGGSGGDVTSWNGQTGDVVYVPIIFSEVTTFISVTLSNPVTRNQGYQSNTFLLDLLTDSGTPISSIIESYEQTTGLQVNDKDGGVFTGFVQGGIIEFPDVVPKGWDFRLVIFGTMTGGRAQQAKVTYYIPDAPGSGVIEEELLDKYIGNGRSQTIAGSFEASIDTRVSSSGSLLNNGIGIAFEQTDGDFTIDRITILIK